MVVRDSRSGLDGYLAHMLMIMRIIKSIEMSGAPAVRRDRFRGSKVICRLVVVHESARKGSLSQLSIIEASPGHVRSLDRLMLADGRWLLTISLETDSADRVGGEARDDATSAQ